MARPSIKASAIRFDDRGRILVDREFQESFGDVTLPPWLGGGTGGGTDLGCAEPVVACVPESACADVSCVPEGTCADVGCVPESACADAGCVPEGACADAGCVPEGICADVACGEIDAACVPESVCADGKCVDLFCGEKNKECTSNLGCGTDIGQVEPL